MRSRAPFLFTLAFAVSLGFALTLMMDAGRLRGALGGTGAVEMRMKNFADANHDRIVNPKEIRGGLVSVIRGVLVGNATYDVNDDGAVNKADTKEAVRVFRLLLGAVCGNAHLDAGEQCDDGGKVNGDGCYDGRHADTQG
jgi:cysteine-rich repeat protein